MDADLSQQLNRIEEALALLRHPLPPRALRLSEVADLLSVSVSFLRSEIQRGKLSAICLPSKRAKPIYRIEQQEYERYLGALKNPLEPTKAKRVIKIPDIQI